MSSTSITIAICTWNRCELLRLSLERLCVMNPVTDVEWNVVVVNNACTDATSDVIKSFSTRLNIREVLEPRPGLSHARNRALQEVTGAWVAWLDVDVLVLAEWIELLTAGIRRYPQAAGFGATIEPWFPAEPDPDLLASFPYLASGFCGLDYGPQERVLEPGEWVFGASMVFSAEAARGLRFDANLGTVQGSGMCGEETVYQDQITARGGRLVWLPQMRVRHYVEPKRMTLSYLIMYSYDRGRAFMRTSRGRGEPVILGVPRWAWRRMIEAYVKYVYSRITFNRRGALSNLREYHNMRGMVTEGVFHTPRAAG